GEDGAPVGGAALGDGVADTNLEEPVQVLRLAAQQRLRRLFGGRSISAELEPKLPPANSLAVDQLEWISFDFKLVLGRHRRAHGHGGASQFRVDLESRL